MTEKLNVKIIQKMNYVDFLALLNETNRPAGGKDSVRRLALNSFVNFKSNVLHSGCNTGYCSFEICHLVKCRVTAIDINKNMIDTAQRRLEKEPKFYREKISFLVGNAHHLAFKDNQFDLVFSGGSTAFMKNPRLVVQEYKRVCKPYGFIGDMCLFYKTKPPRALLEKINELIGISIKPWGKDYWVGLYQNEDLELYYEYTNDMPYMPTERKVKEYCKIMVNDSLGKYSDSVKNAAQEKLFNYMNLFNENHKYLSYCVLLFRKDFIKEQISLFGK